MNLINKSNTNFNPIIYKHSGLINSSIIVVSLTVVSVGFIVFSTIEISTKILIIIGLLLASIVIVKDQFFEAIFYENYIFYRNIFKRITIDYNEIWKVYIYLGNGGFGMDIFYSLNNKSIKITINSIDSFHFRRIRKILEQKNVRVIDETGYS